LRTWEEEQAPRAARCQGGLRPVVLSAKAITGSKGFAMTACEIYGFARLGNLDAIRQAVTAGIESDRLDAVTLASMLNRWNNGAQKFFFFV
jgi:hypothetical protein